LLFFFSSRRRHTRFSRDWSSDECSSDLTAAMMAYYLGKYPEWQERARAESMALGTDEISYADLDRLPSLDLVMKESLRMSAPVRSEERRVGEECRAGRSR